MKKLLSFVAVLAMALVVAAPSVAGAATYYVDPSAAGWSEVAVWTWQIEGENPDWTTESGISNGWPGLKLEKDAATGYFAWTPAETDEDGEPIVVPTKYAVMFNNNVDGGEQTCDALATTAEDGKVCVLTVKNTADDEAADPTRKADQWFGEWRDVAAATEPETTEPETTEPEKTEPEKTEPETTEPETVAPETGNGEKETKPAKTADVAPIAAVSVLAIASMAVVVATKKKMA